MEVLERPKHIEETFKIGMEFAFEGMDVNMFKANTPEEMKLFLEGYKKAIELQQEDEKENSQVKHNIMI